MSVKHWAGAISTADIRLIEYSPVEMVGETLPTDKRAQALLSWAQTWQIRAAESEAAGNVLVIFEIPQAAEADLVNAIERFLQSRPETKKA